MAAEERRLPGVENEDLGLGRDLVCREPWENYYILRRGIMPCCYGHEPIAPMSEWRTAWNSAALQEIRSHLAQGRFSPYCLRSLSCPIVQRHTATQGVLASAPGPVDIATGVGPVPRRSAARAINRLFRGLPARIYRRLRS